MLFTFPSRYLFAIGRTWSLALEGGPPCFPQDCTCLVVLRIPGHFESLSSPGPTTPVIPKDSWFGLFPVRSPLLRESRLISLCRATEMFQFTHVPPSPPMCSVGGLQTSLWRSCLIRNLGVHRLHAAPPERFAGLRVLLRSCAPRHPPRTLCSLFSLLVVFLCEQEIGFDTSM